jgi:hypothetical protein
MRALQHSRYTFAENVVHTCTRYVSLGVSVEEREDMESLLKDPERLMRIAAHYRENYIRAKE